MQTCTFRSSRMRRVTSLLHYYVHYTAPYRHKEKSAGIARIHNCRPWSRLFIRRRWRKNVDKWFLVRRRKKMMFVRWKKYENRSTERLVFWTRRWFRCRKMDVLSRLNDAGINSCCFWKWILLVLPLENIVPSDRSSNTGLRVFDFGSTLVWIVSYYLSNFDMIDKIMPHYIFNHFHVHYWIKISPIHFRSNQYVSAFHPI